jgi:anti-anti-sigma factor
MMATEAIGTPGRGRQMKVVLQIEEADLSGLRMWDQFTEKLTRLVDAGFSEIVIDFGAVRSISSLALGTIVATHQKMASAGNRLVVTNLSDDLKRLVGGTRLLGLVNVE